MHSTLKQGKRGTSTYYHAVEDGPSVTQRRGFFQGWWWEMTAAVATLGCMVAVVYILFRMQDRPADDWTFPINLNSIIAAFVTAAKSTALLILASCVGQSKWLHFQKRPSPLQDLDAFDEASRGPSGALKLLWRLRTRFGTPVLAALVTIIALGVDSFAQQVVKLDQQLEMVEGGNATFWVTDTYNGGAVERKFNGPNTVEASTVDTRMQGAIYRGIYNIPSDVPFNCSSECQWDGSYFTLGFVSDCVNVTAQTLETTVLRQATPGSVSGTAIMTTPGNLTMYYNVSFTSYHTVVDLVGADLTPKRLEDPYLAEFARIGVLRVKEGAEEARVYELGTNNTEIFECTLGFAALEYARVSASGSSLRIGERKVHRLEPVYFGQDDLNRTYTTYNTTGLPEFRVSTPDLVALGAFFASPQFVGGTHDGEGPPPSTGLGPAFLARATTDGGGVAATMARVAQSMTNQLVAARAGEDTGDEAAGRRRPVTGRSARAAVYVRVHWVWLAVPVFVSVAAVALLFVAMARTAYAGAALWKSSALAVLYHDVMPASGEQRCYLHTDVAGLEHLEELTNGVKVGYK